MRYLQMVALAAIVLMGVAMSALLAGETRGVGPGTTDRISMSGAGEEGDGYSVHSAVSADGRFVAFASDSTNLVPGDTNGVFDVFVRDRVLDTIERVSVSSAGEEGNDWSALAAISADGRFVAFDSGATNLVPGDTNGIVSDVFVRDRVLDTTERMSVSSAGEEGNRSSSSWGFAMSPGGRFVAFLSFATNLVPGDTNGTLDVFVRDRVLDTTERISVSSAGEQGNGYSDHPAISADGRFVAFASDSTNLVPGDTNGESDVFVMDRTLGTMERVSVSSAGEEGNAESSRPNISADGRFVAFYSYTTNLVPGDTNGDADVFVVDRTLGTMERVSVSTAGEEGNDFSGRAAISSDGRFVAFYSFATNFAAGGSPYPHIFTRDRTLGTTERVSVSSAGEPGNGSSFDPAISADGRFVAFDSGATNLVPGDTNGEVDVFVRDRCPDGSCVAPPPTASCPSVQLETTVTVSLAESSRWANVKRYHDDCILPAFLGTGSPNDSPYPKPIGGQIAAKAFGTEDPPYQDFLLWTARRNGSFLASRTPVLLVHGWCGEVEGTWKNMAEGLIKNGYRVYAVQFSVPCGSIEPKAEALADAVELVKADANGERVDIVAHSMGGLVTRYYMQGMIDIPKSGNTGLAYPYEGQVRNVVMLGTPNGGVDQIFRHPQLSGIPLLFEGPFPAPWTNDGTLSGNAWISVGSGKYDGVLEMTYPQDVPIKVLPAEDPVWISAAYTGQPSSVTNRAGFTYYAFEEGINTVENLGGNFVHRINSLTLPAGSNYLMVAGTMNCFHDPIVSKCQASMEKPSDGLVFTSSVFSISGPNLTCLTRKANHTMLPGFQPIVNDVVKFLRSHNTNPRPGEPTTCSAQ